MFPVCQQRVSAADVDRELQRQLPGSAAAEEGSTPDNGRLDERRRTAEKEALNQALQKAGDHVGAAKVQAGQGVQAPLLHKHGPAGDVGGSVETPEAARKLEAQGKPDAALEMWVRLKKYAEAARVEAVLVFTTREWRMF